MNDKPKDENNASEDMSLADLLGGGDSEPEAEAPKRVDHRSDEPDSGMVNLAKMVADSSVEVAQTPSMAPPPPVDPTGSQPVYAGGDPSGVVPTQAGMAPPHKKSSAPLVLGVLAILAIAAVGIVFVMKGGDDSEESAALKAQQEMVAQMAAQMEEMKKAQSAGDSKVDEEMAKKMAELQAEIDAAKAKEEEMAKAAEEEAKEEEPVEENKEEPKVEKPKKEKASAGSSSSKPKDDPKPKKSSANDLLDNAKKTVKEKATSSKDELDSLLTGGKKEEEKPKKAASGGLPAKLTKDDIKKGMAPVAARAQKMCAKYSTGAVQVQVVVSGGTGRVKSATPKGSFAASKAGQCVAMAARTAKFSKFKDASQSFLYPIILK